MVVYVHVQVRTWRIPAHTRHRSLFAAAAQHAVRARPMRHYHSTTIIQHHHSSNTRVTDWRECVMCVCLGACWCMLRYVSCVCGVISVLTKHVCFVVCFEFLVSSLWEAPHLRFTLSPIIPAPHRTHSDGDAHACCCDVIYLSVWVSPCVVYAWLAANAHGVKCRRRHLTVTMQTSYSHLNFNKPHNSHRRHHHTPTGHHHKAIRR